MSFTEQHGLQVPHTSKVKEKKKKRKKGNWKRQTCYDKKNSNLIFRGGAASRGIDGQGHPPL